MCAGACYHVPASTHGRRGTGPAHMRTEGPGGSRQTTWHLEINVRTMGKHGEGPWGCRAGPGSQDRSHLGATRSGNLREWGTGEKSIPLSKIIENRYSDEYVYTHFPSSTICNRRKVATAQMSISGWMDKQVVVYPHGGISSSH